MPDMTAWQGLMQTINPQVGLQGPQTVQSPLNAQMGPWSQLAYQMAGSPQQGGLWPTVAAPPALPGTGGGSSGGGGGGSAILGGLLGVLAKNPGLVKSAYNGVSGLLGGGSSAGSLGSIMAGGSAPIAPVSAPAVSELPSVTGAVNAGAADAGASSAAPAATGGLLGAGAASSAGSALGAGAPGVFASGNAAAGSAGASSSLGGAGAMAAAAPFAILAAYGMSKAAASQAENNQGNDLFNAWLHDSGGSTKVVNPPTAQQAAATAQGGLASAGSGYQPRSVIYDQSGNPMSTAQAELAMQQYAQQKGMPTGNFTMSPAQLQQIINSGGYGSQVYGQPNYPKPVGFGG